MAACTAGVAKIADDQILDARIPTPRKSDSKLTDRRRADDPTADCPTHKAMAQTLAGFAQNPLQRG